MFCDYLFPPKDGENEFFSKITKDVACILLNSFFCKNNFTHAKSGDFDVFNFENFKAHIEEEQFLIINQIDTTFNECKNMLLNKFENLLDADFVCCIKKSELFFDFVKKYNYFGDKKIKERFESIYPPAAVLSLALNLKHPDIFEKNNTSYIDVLFGHMTRHAYSTAIQYAQNQGKVDVIYNFQKVGVNPKL